MKSIQESYGHNWQQAIDQSKDHPNYDEVIALFQRLLNGGWMTRSVNDGGETFAVSSVEEAASAVCGVDVSWVNLLSQDKRTNQLFIVLGNDAGECVNDYYCGHSDLDEILVAHCDHYMGGE